MKLTLIFSAIILGTYSLPVDKYVGYRQLTPEELNRLATWTEDSKQNIWELSGQFEGDIILRKEQRNGLIDLQSRWPNREIPYQIDTSAFNSEQISWIDESLAEYNRSTCIRPRRATASDKDYVFVTGGSGCSSFIGRLGGAQQLTLAPNTPGNGCFRKGTILHEFLHALGFFHQQSATERDDYVQIVWENIQENVEHNFEKYENDFITNFGEEYDYGSVLHYSAFAFSKNGEKTIVTKDPNAEIGQRVGLSKIDIAKLQKMYNC